ncbi:TetR/AcrR family transcriptional regulator [Zhihengliuella halotolerans]|uniref:TetR family transcriptional regulator n=1 Tax=Zhihengliuella halotolerans TaxID=370736 RepID=A0A4Q8AES4_9MICC|nr:TetR/AcrR family transcriptional regulator [Zhihengliuella halotolerans]RZU62215.1 TetR family transcriptional regulator [Zhihengliuella halotolerans]
MELEAAREVLLDAAEREFYEKGYQAVSMADLRGASGVSLKQIYRNFPGKEALVVAMLDRRDDAWMGALSSRVELEVEPAASVGAVFDWLGWWLSGAGHRGCAWVNAYGELGAQSPEVTAAVRRHKDRFRGYLGEIVGAAGGGEATARAVFLLAEGAMVAAGIAGSVECVPAAKEAALRLLEPV